MIHVDMKEQYLKNGSQKTDEDLKIMEVLKTYSSRIVDTLGKTSEAFSGYLERGGSPEIGLKLDQFSMQWTSMLDSADYETNSHLDLAFYPDAHRLIELFGATLFGKRLERPGVLKEGEFGYQPDRIRQFEMERSSSGVLDGFGSGGTPEALRDLVQLEGTDAGMTFAGNICQNGARDSAQQKLQFFREARSRSLPLDKVAWCKTARSIQLCWKVNTTLGGDLGAWLLKIAVHAACSLQRRDIGPPIASYALFQLSREISGLLQLMVSIPTLEHLTADVSVKIVTINSMLMEAGFGFVSAGQCLTFASEQPEIIENLINGTAETCCDLLTTTARVFAKVTPWRELIKSRIKETNFCSSRLLTTTLELHSRDMFHLISRSHHITTSRRLHLNCGDTCKQAEASPDKDDLPGHLNEKCPEKCQVECFKPIETLGLVLFDTVNQKLKEFEAAPPYVAVSQIWFQGIFGQKSRKCGACSLDYLRTVCNKIGVQYAWIDTLCMPSQDTLRPRAVEQLRNIYLQAKATLVVDAGLISTKAQTALDLSLAVWLSDWASRVWTLQEGVLASKLLFCVGNDVLALPQVRCPDSLKDTRYMVSSKVLAAYGQGKQGLGIPLDVVLNLAAGRQTSWQQDYMYGLSALFPSPKLARVRDVGLVAMEVAKMYRRVDLGILQAPFERCRTEGFRWMPQKAETMHRQFETGVYGDITATGLRCQVTALIQVASVDERPSETHRRSAAVLDFYIKDWYTTEIRGVSIGTCVDAKDLIFCRVGHENDDTSYGFVVSPTAHRGVFQYIRGAVMFGKVPAKPESILVT